MDDISIRLACTDLIVRYAWMNDERRFEELAALFGLSTTIFIVEE